MNTINDLKTILQNLRNKLERKLEQTIQNEY